MKNTLHSCLLVLPFLVLFIIPSSLTAQYFINKSWDKSFSELSDVNWSSSIMNTNGEFLTITHKVIDPSQTDLLLIKQDKNGNTIWETQFGNSNEKIYGVDLSLDPNGNIYVIGARQKSTEEYDYLIIKYNSSAIEQWHTYFDGAANGNDIPTSIIFNSFDSNVYVTGSSEGAGTNTDYSTLKVDGTLGTVLWEARYDHLNMGELPVSIEIGWSGDIIVTGGSANSTTDWDIATLQYNLLGMEQNVTRVNNNSSGFDQPTAIVKDVNDNFYITGNIIDSSTGTYDIYTAKMDLNLNIVWDTIYSGVSGLEDLAFDIKVDNQDNVYVCGTSENEDLGKDILLLKYSSSGALLWDKQRNAEQKQEMAIGRKIAITNNGQIVLTGDVSKNEETNILTIKYDNTGKRLWEKYQHVETTGINQPFAVHIDNDDIFVSGFSKENEFATFTTNTNFKLQVYDRNAQLKYDTSGSPVHTINEILVRFNPDVVNQNFVNDQGLSFGTVDEIIDDTTLINAMDNVLGANGVIGDFKMMKIFPFLTTDKTTITSRLGRKVALPKLWSAMILKLESSAKINEFILSEALDTLPNILYAHPEFTGEVGWVNPPNDLEYTDQHSLTFHNNTSPLYPDAHINVEPAWVKIDWDNGDNNLNNIKVGIYDTGLYYEHEDFGFGGVNNYGGLEGTIVDGGWDFESTITMPFPLLSSLDNPDLIIMEHE